jgi:hypothetical protein
VHSRQTRSRIPSAVNAFFRSIILAVKILYSIFATCNTQFGYTVMTVKLVSRYWEWLFVQECSSNYLVSGELCLYQNQGNFVNGEIHRFMALDVSPLNLHPVLDLLRFICIPLKCQQGKFSKMSSFLSQSAMNCSPCHACHACGEAEQMPYHILQDSLCLFEVQRQQTWPRVSEHPDWLNCGGDFRATAQFVASTDFDVVVQH